MSEQLDIFKQPRPRIPLATRTRDAAYARIQGDIEAAFHTEGHVELSPRQATVYAVIAAHPDGISNSEISEWLNWPINTVTPRTHELRALTFVTRGPRRACTVTGFTVQTWVPTLRFA